MQSSDSFHGIGYTFWTFWIIALHLLYKLWISNILATSITEETCIVEMHIVEMRIWCNKIGTVNFITTTGSMPLLGGLLVPEGITTPVASTSVLASKYGFFVLLNLLLQNDRIIIN